MDYFLFNFSGVQFHYTMSHILMCLEIVALPNLARPQSFEESSQNFFDCWINCCKKIILFLSYTFNTLY